MSVQSIEIVYTTSLGECLRLKKEGYEPIAARFKDKGKVRFVEGRKKLGARGSKLLRKALGYQPEPGIKFVTSSKPAPEVTLAMAYLAGRVRADDLLLKITDHLEGKESAETIGLITLHNLLFGAKNGTAPLVAGVVLWSVLIPNHEETIYKRLIEAGTDLEVTRREEATKAIEVGTKIGQVLIVESRIWGFDRWHKVAPVVVMYNDAKKKILVGVKEHGRKLFPGGIGKFLKDNFGEGWGGTAFFGGSPAVEPQDKEMAYKVGETISLFLG